MEILKEQYPKTFKWIDSLQPFIVIRGEKQVILKFSDDRQPLELSYEKIMAFENSKAGENFSWS